MNGWWYAEKEKKSGPFVLEELKKLLQSGKIDKKTMLWREGMGAWQPLDEINELQSIKTAVPPPLPPQTTLDPLTFPLATQWPRFFSRIFDVWWEILLISFVVGVFLNRYSAGFVEWINGPGTSQLFGILCLPLGLILDASVYRFMGNTPGKALLGLKIGTIDGKTLTFGQYLSRNFSMWATGLALGFPLINLFTMARQSGRLSKGQQASYDEFTGYRVRAKPLGWMRKVGFGFAFASVFLLMIVLNSMEETAQHEAILSRASQDYSWENPITRLNAKIDSHWKYSVQPNASGQQTYMFSERGDRAIVIFAVERAPGYAVSDYVRAFQKSTAASMAFSDGGRFFEKGGRQNWQGSGRLVDSTDHRLSVHVTQVDSNFWRVVTIQTMPYDYSDRLVAQLHAALWGTVQ